MHQAAESRQRIWIVPASPVVWAVHFMASYITAAVWCGRFTGEGAPLGPARLAIAVYTVVALAAIAWIGMTGLTAQRLGAESPPYDADSPEDRHRFLGRATVLLSGLSAVATIFSALAAVFVETCR